MIGVGNLWNWLIANKFRIGFHWWLVTGSNCGQSDLQSDALPSELTNHKHLTGIEPAYSEWKSDRLAIILQVHIDVFT